MGWAKALLGDRWVHDYAANLLAEIEQGPTDERRVELLAALAWVTDGETPQ
jgi:hypothetical protein